MAISPLIILSLLYVNACLFLMTTFSASWYLFVSGREKSDFFSLWASLLLTSAGIVGFLATFKFSFSWIICLISTVLLTLLFARHRSNLPTTNHLSALRRFSLLTCFFIVITLPFGIFSFFSYQKQTHSSHAHTELNKALDIVQQISLEDKSVLENITKDSVFKNLIDTKQYSQAYTHIQSLTPEVSHDLLLFVSSEGAIPLNGNPAQENNSLIDIGQPDTSHTTLRQGLISGKDGAPLLLSIQPINTSLNILMGTYLTSDFLAQRIKTDLPSLAVANKRGIASQHSVSSLRSLLNSFDIIPLLNSYTFNSFNLNLIYSQEKLYYLSLVPLPSLESENPYALLTLQPFTLSVSRFNYQLHL